MMGFIPGEELVANAHETAAAARRGYAAGSRDGAREMRLKAARLVASMNCCCCILEFADDDFAGLIRSNPGDNNREVVSHDPRCPAALAEAIRRLPDGGEGEGLPAGEGPLAGWGGGS